MPQKPRTSQKDADGTIVIYTRLPAPLHAKALRLAKSEATTLGQWVKEAVTARVDREERRRP